MKLIAGADEAGRGAWAGPLVAAAVIMPSRKIVGVRDSKQLSPRRRTELFSEIITQAVACTAVSIPQDCIDTLGVHQANLFALSYVITHLQPQPDLALIDGFEIDHYIATQAVVGGDASTYVIAAASIIAKVTRDWLMQRADRYDARYGYARHKGYGTQLHQQQLQQFGASRWHRQSFAPVQRILYTKGSYDVPIRYHQHS